MQSLVTQTLLEMGDISSIMDRSDKVELIRRLDERGVVQVSKAISLLADLPGLSRATGYNYLREARISGLPTTNTESLSASTNTCLSIKTSNNKNTIQNLEVII